MKHLLCLLVSVCGLLIFLGGSLGLVSVLDHPTGQLRDLVVALLFAMAMVAGALAGVLPVYYLTEEA